MEELDVIGKVSCPMVSDEVDIEDCAFCEYYIGMGDLDFTLKCGFEDGERNCEEEE